MLGMGLKIFLFLKNYHQNNIKLKKIDFIFDETKKTEDIVYHTKEELEKMLNENIKAKLDEKGWLSNDINSYTLKLQIIYERKYFMDKMPFFISSDALLFPIFRYNIFVLDNSGKAIRSFESAKRTMGESWNFHATWRLKR